MDTLEQRRILRLKEVTRLIGISRSSLYSMVAKGGFPAPIRIGAHSSGWRLADLDAWLAAPERLWSPSGKGPGR